MSARSKVTREERELFRHTVGTVVPVQQKTVNLPPRRPKPVPRQTEADEQAVLDELAAGDYEPAFLLETGDEIQFRRDGIQMQTMRKLRRGQFSIQAELDLHGMSAAAARQALTVFLAQSRQKQLRCVRIVHGKGRGSRDGRPVLKQKLQVWLRQCNDIMAYCSTRPEHGGTGAVYVLLRKR